VAIRTWVGGQAPNPTSWNNANNWSGRALPVEGDDVVIAAVTNEPGLDVIHVSLQSLTVNLGANLTLSTLTFNTTSVINSGTITGANPVNHDATGVKIFNAVGTLTNSGTITGDVRGDGVLMGGGLVTNSASGIITGGLNAVEIDSGGFATMTNAGTIRGTGPGAIGVLFSDTFRAFDNKLINSGTIIGDAAAAVQFGGGNDTLKLLPGASFIGLVDGGLGANTLELGAGAGHLAGVGTEFTNFGTLLLDSGALWTLAGSGNDGLGAIAISGFTAFDTIDLTGLAFNSVSGSFANNLLRLTNAAAAQATLHIQGNFASSDFAFSSDGAGGTNIQLATPSGSIRSHGAHNEYVIVNDNGTLVVEDTVAGRDGTQRLSGVDDVLFSDGTGVFDPTGTTGTVLRLYQAALNRTPDLAGLKFWTSDIDSSHVPLGVVASSFANSPEFIHNYGSLSDTDFIQRLYQNVLNRAGDPSGAQFWQTVLSSGVSRGAVALDFTESPENRAKTLSIAGDKNDAEATRLYQAALGRTPDRDGESYWASALANGTTPSQVAQGFISSAEFNQTFGTLSGDAFVSALYHNVLHRAPDAPGMQFWTNTLQQGTSEANVLVSFSDGLENRMQTAGATHDGWVFIHA
jgi:hypothetical protein